MQTIRTSDGRFIHVQPSPRAHRLFWHLLGAGRAKITGPQSRDAFALPGAVILWVQSGHGEMRLASGTYALRPGPVFWFYSSQQDRQWRPASDKPYTTKNIRFGGPHVGAWLDELDVKKNAEFRVASTAWLDQLQRDLIRLAVKQAPDWEYRIHLMLSKVMCRLLAIRKPSAPPQHELPVPIARVFDAIAVRPDHPWQARDLPAVAGVSYSHLRDLFRETLHDSIHGFLAQRRLDRARMLLAEGKLSVKEISEKLHFGNEFYFSAFFKAQTGYSPTQFRKQLRGR